MRRVSPKRARENRELAKTKLLVHERDDETCQAPPDVPHGGRLVVHHIVPVGRDGTLRNDIDNLVLICALAHAWVHDHPFLATRLGLLKSAGLGSVPPGDPR